MDDNSEAVGIVSTSESMEDVLQLSNRSYSTGDRLKMCCRPTYQAWKLKNKGSSSNIGLELPGDECISLSYYTEEVGHRF